MSQRLRDPLATAFGIMALGVLTFSVSSTSSHAEEPTTLYPTACPFTVRDDNRVVELTQDLAFPHGDPATCLAVVEANNVIIRLNGYSIVGNGGNIDIPPPPDGIRLVSANNVAIEGPGTVENFARSIALIGSKNVGINGVELDDNSRGIQIGRRGFGFNAASNDVTITNTNINNSSNRDDSDEGGQGIVVFSYTNPDPTRPDEVTENIHIANVKIKNSENRGIAFGFSGASDPNPGARFLVENCEISDSVVGISIAAASDITVRDCEITDQLAEAIVAGSAPFAIGTISGLKVRDSILRNNGFGLHLLEDNVLDDVKLRGNCFENNFVFNIRNESSVDIIELDNELDPIGGC